MALTDPIADILTRIRNAHLAFHETLDVPHSNMKEAIVKILAEEGYIQAYQVTTDQKPFKTLSIVLKYIDNRQPAITSLQRISKPGRRVYVGKDDIPQVLGGLGINILSTSKGVLSGHGARKEGVGGELLCSVY